MNETAGYSDRRFFAAGIAFGLTPAVAHHAGSRIFIASLFGGIRYVPADWNCAGVFQAAYSERRDFAAVLGFAGTDGSVRR